MVMDMPSVRSYAVSRGDVQWEVREVSGVQSSFYVKNNT